MKSNRRTFIATTATTIAATTLTSFTPKPDKKVIAHHVFFWLKNPSSIADRDKIIAGLRTLKKIETIREIHIGIPASTEKREVVDNSYSVSELMFFDDLAGQQTYQDHPIHKKFIEDCSMLWEKVIVYDAIDA